MASEIRALRDDVPPDSDGGGPSVWHCRLAADRSRCLYRCGTLIRAVAILEPWSVLRPWDFAWALDMY
jgi:hypothetical protein